MSEYSKEDVRSLLNDLNMTKNKTILALLLSALLSFSGVGLFAQHAQRGEDLLVEKKYTLYFRVNESVLDATYMGNSEVMELIADDIQNCLKFKNDSTIRIDIVASASPEGRYPRNVKLSQNRKETIVSFIQKSINVSEVTFSANSFVEDWDMVVDYVKANQDVPHRDEVLAAILGFEGKDDFQLEIQRKLQEIDGGKTYEWLREHVFAYLRSCKIVAIYNMTRPVAHVKIAEVESPKYALQAASTGRIPQKSVERVPLPGFTPFIKLKVNTIGLALGHANIAAEYAFAEHFSVALPFYYSGGFDYFKETLKFRGIVVQPEVRYYIKGNEGFYVGAHLGLGWYNYALNGTYRIQDHKGRTPAYGGGLGLGYALNFKKNPRWGMEFCIGAGAYKAKYDIFYNEPNGPYEETAVEKVFFGLDNVSVAFTYNFNIRKEGRK